MTTTLEQRAIEDLVTRIDACLSVPTGRIIGFIASGRGEGTSTLAEAYATTLISYQRRNVLLLGVDGASITTPGVLSTLAAGLPLDDCLRPFAGRGFTGSLGGHDALWELLTVTKLWQDLRSRFDDIVLDLPDSSSSRLGLQTAPQCDGVVIVIEAEKSRAPVVENLIASLRAVRAPLLGTVLNRRQFYLPKRIYNWL